MIQTGTNSHLYKHFIQTRWSSDKRIYLQTPRVLLKMTSANAWYTVNTNKNARAVLMAFLLNKLELEIAHYQLSWALRFIGTSLSGPHVDRKASPMNYLSMYAYVFP